MNLNLPILDQVAGCQNLLIAHLTKAGGFLGPCSPLPQMSAYRAYGLPAPDL